ncbi:MAG: hypothetical protein EA412_04950 [Chitinophagaceae bacterium]|nr:MAG: hypothetical protein EA412_04950 [Chitinophagaceae bacterium]
MMLTKKSFLKYSLLSVMLLTLFTGCTEGDFDEDATLPHYDIRSLMKEVTEDLITRNPEVEKEIRLNGSVEVKRLQIDNWENELFIFTEADINRPSYVGKYSIDTINIAGGNILLHYVAKEENLTTKEMKVYLSDFHSKPDSLMIRTASENFLNQTTQKMKFIPGKGYSLEGYQNIWLLNPREIFIEVMF